LKDVPVVSESAPVGTAAPIATAAATEAATEVVTETPCPPILPVLPAQKRAQRQRPAAG
jgi:hypothetical protein